MFNIILSSTSIVVNSYCIMLQRYNVIRINQVVNKMTPRYEKQKDEIKEEIIKENTLVNQYNYKIVKEDNKEVETTFEELIENATLSELKQYLERLEYFNNINKQNNQCLERKIINIKTSDRKLKVIKLELKPN